VTLVDTTVWIPFFSGMDTLHVALLGSLIDQREDLCVCGVILTEILQGIKDEKEYAKTQAMILDLIYIPMNRETFLLAAHIYRSLRTKGITVRNSIDCMIAALCVENKVALLHNDRDFDYISQHFDLKIPNPPARY